MSAARVQIPASPLNARNAKEIKAFRAFPVPDYRLFPLEILSFSTEIIWPTDYITDYKFASHTKTPPVRRLCRPGALALSVAFAFVFVVALIPQNLQRFSHFRGEGHAQQRGVL